MELFCENNLQLLAVNYIPKKSYIVEVRLGSKYASEYKTIFFPDVFNERLMTFEFFFFFSKMNFTMVIFGKKGFKPLPIFAKSSIRRCSTGFQIRLCLISIIDAIFIRTSRLIIDGKTRTFQEQCSVRICKSKKFPCERHIHFSLSLIQIIGKFAKHNYSKISRDKNI